MVVAAPDGGEENVPQGETLSARDLSKLIPEHPIPIYDPPWLRRLHDRCLWDGGTCRENGVFCSHACEEWYADWEHRTTHIIAGREPLLTFLEQGREIPR